VKLKGRGIYEECLYFAFTQAKSNHSDWPEKVLDWLFRLADPPRLRAAGEALPGPGPFRVYRGVAGMGRARRLRGYSWTGSLDVACWFATRRRLQSPAILTAVVGEEEVLAYHDGRDEQEFICRPIRPSRHPIRAPEMEERTHRHEALIRASERVKLRAFLEKNNPEMLARLDLNWSGNGPARLAPSGPTNGESAGV
jgi:hypothetical protein